ncbi:cytosine permease [Alteromonas sp. I4]|nr:cytosine permease [Alteromonas sp. I4]
MCVEPPYDTDTQSVQPEQKVNWPRVASVSAMVSFSIPTFVTGIELFGALNWQHAFIAMGIGAVLLTLIGGLMGDIGAATGKNSYMLVQRAFGKRGAAMLNLLFALSLVGWFGVNLDLFSASIMQVIGGDNTDPVSATVIEAIAGIAMVGTTLFGFSMINRLSTWLVPVMVAFGIGLLWLALGMTPVSALTESHSHISHTISDGVNMIVGVIIIGAIILPDITRFSHQRRGGVYTAFWSYFIAQSAVLLIAAYAAVAFGSRDILNIIMAMGLGSWALLIVIAGSWVLNSLNIYSAQLAVSVNLPAVSANVISVVLGCLGMLAAFFNILDHFITFLSILTALFIPVAGIVALDVHRIRSQAYSAGARVVNLNLPAVVAWVAGASYANMSLFYALPGITEITAIDALLLATLLYWVGSVIKPTGTAILENN